MKKKLILCAGIPRSGSTWMYNMIRLMLERSGRTVYGAWIQDYQPEMSADVHLVKVHEPLGEDWLKKADVIFCSHRDLRDIAASSIRMGWAKNDEEVITLLDNVLKMHSFWSAKASYELHYEDLLENSLAPAADMARVLGLHLKQQQLYQICQETDALEYRNGKVHDSITLLHPHHRQVGRHGRFRDELSPELIQQIECQFGPWLVNHRYMELDAWMREITEEYRFLWRENLGLKQRIHDLEQAGEDGNDAANDGSPCE